MARSLRHRDRAQRADRLAGGRGEHDPRDAALDPTVGGQLNEPTTHRFTQGIGQRRARRPATWVPGQGVYAASKAGVRALCEVLRQETGPDIRATMIGPGATATEFVTDQRGREQMAAIAMAPGAVAEAIVNALEQSRASTSAKSWFVRLRNHDPAMGRHCCYVAATSRSSPVGRRSPSARPVK
jgi:NAD(P)-dependent dehydrogenase (short-subunit alcohol dehydrogenase family)